MKGFGSKLMPQSWLVAFPLAAVLVGWAIPGAAQGVTVLSTSPSNGATNTPTSTNGSNNIVTGTAISATFSEAMDPATVDSAVPGALLTFTLKDSGGSNIDGIVTMNAANTVATFKPKVSALNTNENYIATITTAAESAGGIALPNPVQWSFTTGERPCTGQAPVEAGASQIASFFSSTPGAVLTPSFTLNSAYKNLMAVMKECTTSACTSFTATAPACSVDAFSVRPTSVTLSSSANNAGTTGLPTVKAGGNFTVTATTTAGYTGTYAVNPAAINVVAPATVLGVLTNSGFSAANGASPNSTATATFTYSDVGAVFLGTTSASPPPYIVPPFVYDETWTAVDSVTTKNDCNTDLNVMTDLGFSNTMD